MRNITIRDIARQAGVSKSTTSRVINNVGNVNEDLRRRVNNVVNELGLSCRGTHYPERIYGYRLHG